MKNIKNEKDSKTRSRNQNTYKIFLVLLPYFFFHEGVKEQNLTETMIYMKIGIKDSSNVINVFSLKVTMFKKNLKKK